MQHFDLIARTEKEGGIGQGLTIDVLLVTTRAHPSGDDRLGHTGVAVDGELAAAEHDGRWLVVFLRGDKYI